MSNQLAAAPHSFRNTPSKLCAGATPREARATLRVARRTALLPALLSLVFTSPARAEPAYKCDVAFGVGVGATDSGSAAGLDLQVNFRDAGWMARLGGVAGLGHIAYLGAGKLWIGDLSETFSYALHAGLEAAAVAHKEISCGDSGTTTSDNWILGGDDCDSTGWKAFGGGAAVGASIDAHFGAFLLGLHLTGQALATAEGPAGAAILAVRLGAAFR